jgi:hypothetical protein
MSTLAETEAQVRQLHARYTDAVWRKDAQAFAKLFTPEGEWRISGLAMRGRGEIEAAIDKIFSSLHRVLFTYGDPVLDHVAGELRGRVMVNERVAWADGRANISIGRYFERYGEWDGRLCFDWRLFELHYRGAPDFSGEWFEHPDPGAPPAMPPRDRQTVDVAQAKWGLAK